MDATAVTRMTVHWSAPKSVWPILMAANITSPVVITLKTMPR